jgi:hypothetical protein
MNSQRPRFGCYHIETVDFSLGKSDEKIMTLLLLKLVNNAVSMKLQKLRMARGRSEGKLFFALWHRMCLNLVDICRLKSQGRFFYHQSSEYRTYHVFYLEKSVRVK